MRENETINDIRDRLREEGYTAETIGAVLREVNRSFLVDDAGALVEETRAKALELEVVLGAIYQALIDEPVLDLHIRGTTPYTLGRVSDEQFDVRVNRSSARRLSIAFESRRSYLVEKGRQIRLGELQNRENREASQTEETRLVLLRVRIEPTSRQLPNPESSSGPNGLSITIQLNRPLVENDDSDVGPMTAFESCLHFIDFVSDNYAVAGYKQLLDIVSGLADQIGTHLGGKRAFLEGLDFT